MNIEGKCISDEELREERLHDVAVEIVNYACDLTSKDLALDIDEWHQVIDEIVILLHAHKASANYKPSKHSR